jgi:parvulin-like peptidyl-prolyl isomerase
MKECPNCKKEYDDNETYCLEDGTVLESVEPETEAETVGLSADEVPATVTEEVKTEVAEDQPIVKAEPAKAMAATVSSGGELSSSSKLAILLAVILLSGIGLLVWKIKVGGQSSEGLTKLTKADMETIFEDVPPQALKQLAEDSEAKKKEIEGIKQFLAIAQEARTNGFADKPEIKKELEEMKMGILAQSYDKEINKEKENLPPFSSIAKEQVDAYFQKGTNQEKFDEMLKQEIADAKKEGKIPADFEVPADQLEQFKDRYAKVRIYADEAKEKWSSLSEDFKKKTEFQIKFQQAQFLVQRYAQEELTKKLEVTPEELNKYLTEHPEVSKIFDERKAKAEEVLKRAKAGEDFAKLAQEFSDDPSGKRDGGLIKDITKGSMVKEFEQASLALEPGQITDSVVWTKFGYHIIKLERKGPTKDETGKEVDTYDVRHILIGVKEAGAEKTDPNNPMAQPAFLRDKIEKEIAKEKQKKVLDDIVARNPIEIEDFEIKVPPMPEGQPNMPGMPNGQNGQQQISPEQMEQLQKQIQQMQQQQKNAPKSGDKQAPPKDTKPAANKSGK